MATKAHYILEYHCYQMAPLTPKKAETTQALWDTAHLNALLVSARVSLARVDWK